MISKSTFRSLLHLSFIAATYAGPSGTSKIQWGPCNETEIISVLPVECGSVIVPLDYTAPNSNETLKLELVKVLATVQPSKGSILLNFGGPGEEARVSLGLLSSMLQPLSGGVHDLIAFDPRGTGVTIPFTWLESDVELLQFQYGYQRTNESDVAMGKQWARGKIDADVSYERANKLGSLVSTAFVARDLISVVDLLEEDGLLRYWGFSYGTTLGATVAAMFPDRIDKMVLDGVQNPHEYYFANGDFEEWSDSDKVFSGIFSACADAPDSCALARENATGAELEQSVWDLIDTFKYNPIAIGNTLIDYTFLKDLISGHLYTSAGWPELTSLLNNILTGNLTGAAETIGPYAYTKSDAQLIMALSGIHCGDKSLRVATLDEFLPFAEQLQDTSRIMGDSSVWINMRCAQWKIEPKERFVGDFNVQTNPVLFIGNKYDGHTPLRSAYNVSATFEGSAVLEVDGYGHSSLATPSSCVLKKTADYWVTGNLPAPGTLCEVEGSPFSGITWNDILVAAGDGPSSVSDKKAYGGSSKGLIGRRYML